MLAVQALPAQEQEFREIALRFLTQLRPSQLDGCVTGGRVFFDDVCAVNSLHGLSLLATALYSAVQ